MSHGHYQRVKHKEGRKNATDEQIRELCKKGWFLNQIRQHYKIGFPRLRKIAREVEAAL